MFKYMEFLYSKRLEEFCLKIEKCLRQAFLTPRGGLHFILKYYTKHFNVHYNGLKKKFVSCFVIGHLLNVIKKSRQHIWDLCLGLYNFRQSMYDNYFHQIFNKMHDKNFYIEVKNSIFCVKKKFSAFFAFFSRFLEVYFYKAP